MDIIRIIHGTALWKKTIKYAEYCSWVVGKHAAKLLRDNVFADWEAFFCSGR